ncbi:hypothetical protein VPNG_07727 [Cytospora leucostoma]|uniref:Uncharacterized protein n=1 Tax=Cytospora leucostoma TaxID=1230097 RepID=A0A423W8B9_9PEZI|nr:hypothetical protein VPNG_07727 [Cytospora leucostoma]
MVVDVVVEQVVANPAEIAADGRKGALETDESVKFMARKPLNRPLTLGETGIDIPYDIFDLTDDCF